MKLALLWQRGVRSEPLQAKADHTIATDVERHVWAWLAMMGAALFVAWWFATAAIKLGLLGTVVGFIAMSLQVGEMRSLDFDQVQVLLKRMTQGMAIALYTTLVGLIANLWLGLQLMLLDRLAADILAETL